MAVRVAFDGRYINDRYHGIGRVAFGLLEALAQLDTDDELFVFFHPGYPNGRFDLTRLGAQPRVHLLPVRLPLLVPTEQAAWPILLRRVRADLFHSPYAIGPIIGPTPTIVTVHDLIFERFPGYTPRRALRYAYRALAGASIRHAAAVVAVSDATRKDLRHWYPSADKKTHVVPNGVDASFIRVTDPRRLADVAARYSLPRRFVLGVGAGRPHKNLEILVEAARQFADDPELHVVLLSNPDPRFPDRVAERIARLGLATRVTRIPAVHEADMAAVYSLADVFVMPSFVEGFGLPILEAMSAGTAVIAAATSSLPEVGGDAALYFNPTDAGELARLIQRLRHDDALRAGQIALGRCRAGSFTWDKAARATHDLYRRVLAGPARTARADPAG